MHLLHQESHRLDTYRALAPYHPFVEPMMVAVVDPALIGRIFRSDAFRVVDYTGIYRTITERTGIDFSGILAAFAHVPLAQEGARHKEIRAKMARLFGSIPADSEGKLRLAVAEICDETFRPGTTVDLVADFVVPVFNALFSILLAIDRRQLTEDASVSQIFDGLMSLNRRKRIDRALTEMLAELVEAKDGLPVDPEIALALNVLGQDALIGSLTLSLWHDFGANAGLALDRSRFSPVPSATSVAYIDRVAIEDVTIGDLSMAAGEIARLYLDATTIEALGEDGGMTFGKGRHSCLGKPLSLSTWRIITQCLAKSPLAVTLGDIEIRKADHVFIYPNRATVHVGH